MLYILQAVLDRSRPDFDPNWYVTTEPKIPQRDHYVPNSSSAS